MSTGRQRAQKMAAVIDMLSFLLSRTPRAFRYFILNNSNGSNLISIGLRYCAFRSLARHCGNNVYIGRYTTFKNLHNLAVGHNVSFHEYCYLDASGGVSIGNDVSVAAGTKLFSFEHQWDDARTPIKYNPVKLLRVTIDDDVWIGCGCSILAGSHIGRRCVVAAGAVVKGHLESGYLFAGAPARPKRALPMAGGDGQVVNPSSVP